MSAGLEIAALEWLFDLIGIVPALPLFAALCIAIFMLSGRAHGDGAEAPTARLALFAAGGGLALILAMAWVAWWGGSMPGTRVSGVWFASADLSLRISFTLDRLSLSMATLVAAIGLITLRFSRFYLHREAGFHRFFFGLCLFLAGMQLIALGGSALMVFLGWELVGIASWLLVAYRWQRLEATGNALFVFGANRIGDAGFLLGLALSAWWFKSFEWADLFGGGHLPVLSARLLAFGFVVAALVKSAQFPFTPWIARALEGPTPSSAIFYGSLMVHAGVMLVIRLEPLLVQAPDVLFGLAVAGTATALYAALCTLVQTDVKSALIFATVFQVGLMFVACGLGWFQLAAWHLALHAIWRAWQFLHSPSWLALVDAPPRPVPPWLARQQWLYTAALQRFWLHRLGDVLMARPTTALAEDARELDERVIDPLIGQPGEGRPVAMDLPLVRSDGLAGKLLMNFAEWCHLLEGHLAMRGRGGASERFLRHLGRAMRHLESLLEQPRYLMLAVMLTFVVIL